MSEKGTQTKKNRARAQGPNAEAIRRGLRPVTFTITQDIWPEASDEDIKSWRERGEIYARILAHPDCPQTFADTFKAIFVDELFTKSNIADVTSPAMIRALYPMVLADMVTSVPATNDGVEASLLRVMESLVPAEIREPIRAAVMGQKGGAK